MSRRKGAAPGAVEAQASAAPAPARPGEVLPGLVFLERSSTARKLATAWQTLPEELELQEGEDEAEALDRLWAGRAGVAVEAVRTWAPVLLGNGLCLDGGRLAPAVLELLTARAGGSERRAPR